MTNRSRITQNAGEINSKNPFFCRNQTISKSSAFKPGEGFEGRVGWEYPVEYERSFRTVWSVTAVAKANGIFSSV